MSKTSDALLQQMFSYLQQNLQRTQAAAAEESPYLHQIGQDANTFLDQINKKDYSHGFTPGSFWSLDSLGNREARRDEMMNAGGLGDSALALPQGGGGSDSPSTPGFLELDKQNRANEFKNNYAREFQNAVQTGTQNAKSAQFQLGQLDQNRRAGVAGDVSNLFNIANSAENQKPMSFGQSLIMGGLQAMPGILQGIGQMGSNQEGNDTTGTLGPRPAPNYGPGGGWGSGLNTGSGPTPWQIPGMYSTTRTISNPGFGGWR